MNGVIIRGGGTAAYCSAHLLQKAGIRVSLQVTARAKVPAIMLNDVAVGLMRDVFTDEKLFEKAHRIRKRIVAWGAGAKPMKLDHSAVVVSEEKLIGSLHGVVDAPEDQGRANWMILAARPLPCKTSDHSFGSRKARAIRVSLKPNVDSSACWVESLDNGWLFLVPNDAESAWLLAVGGKPESLLNESRLVVDQLMGLGESGAEFPTYPRIVSPLCGDGWLACGTAAMAFDPICGDGTAHAVREAILAVAVIRAAADGEEISRLAEHYESRLLAGFHRHLLLCKEFYRRGHDTSWWREETRAIEEGLEWCSRRESMGHTFQYKLSGFQLEAVGP